MNKNQKKWLVISIVIIIVLALGLGLGLGLGLKNTDTRSDFKYLSKRDSEKKNNQLTISIVIVTRNDDYGLNQKDRFGHFLNNIPKNKIINELVIVEWNPLTNKQSIHELLTTSWKFGSGQIFHPKNLPNTVRVIEVSREEHDKLNSELPVIEYIGKNVGVHRTNSDFVLITNPDIIFNKEIFDHIEQNGLSDNEYYRAQRIDVHRKVSHLPGNVHDNAKNNILSNIQRMLTLNHKIDDAPGDFLLCHKNIFLNLGGYLESTKFFTNFDSEIMYRLDNAGLKKIILPGTFYHIDHNKHNAKELDYNGQCTTGMTSLWWANQKDTDKFINSTCVNDSYNKNYKINRKLGPCGLPHINFKEKLIIGGTTK